MTCLGRGAPRVATRWGQLINGGRYGFMYGHQHVQRRSNRSGQQQQQQRQRRQQQGAVARAVRDALPAAFEALEGRRMLSTTLSGGLLSVVGTREADNVSVALAA